MADYQKNRQLFQAADSTFLGDCLSRTRVISMTDVAIRGLGASNKYLSAKDRYIL